MRYIFEGIVVSVLPTGTSFLSTRDERGDEVSVFIPKVVTQAAALNIGDEVRVQAVAQDKERTPYRAYHATVIDRAPDIQSANPTPAARRTIKADPRKVVAQALKLHRIVSLDRLTKDLHVPLADIEQMHDEGEVAFAVLFEDGTQDAEDAMTYVVRDLASFQALMP